MAAGIYDIRGGTEAAYNNLKKLARGMQVWPSDIYTWPAFFTNRYGVNTTGEGSTQQVNRLRPLTAPTAATLADFDVPQTRNAISTAAGNLQKAAYDKVEIEVFERGLIGTGNADGPVAIKKQTLALAQQDVLAHTQFLLMRNRHEYLNIKCRETLRSAICSTVFGALRTSAATITDTTADNLSVAIMKEMRRRLRNIQARKFGSGGISDGDAQLLDGTYAAIIDVNGENQLTSDAVFREFARYELDNRKKFTRGFVGEIADFSFYVTETGATATGGASGEINLSEVIVLAQDPTFVATSGDQDQSFTGEFPVVHAQVGPLELVRAKEDNFERDWLVTWLVIEGFAPLEVLASGDATALTTLMGGGKYGVATTGSSRFVHAIRHSRATV